MQVQAVAAVPAPGATAAPAPRLLHRATPGPRGPALASPLHLRVRRGVEGPVFPL